MPRPKRDVNAAFALVAKDLLENNQNVADIGIFIGALGDDSLKWLKDLKKECSSIDEFIDIAKQRAHIALVAAAVKCALGYEYQETDQSFIRVPAGYDDAGIPKMREVPSSKKVKTKRALPNESMQRFLLKCRLPEWFQDVQRVEINKKVIEIKELAGKEIKEFGRKLLESIDNEN